MPIVCLALIWNAVLLDGYTMFRLSIHQLMDIWIVSSFGFDEFCCCEHMYTSIFCAHVFISLGCIPRGGIARSCGKPVFNILRYCQSLCHSDCTVLHSHQCFGHFPACVCFLSHLLILSFLALDFGC